MTCSEPSTTAHGARSISRETDESPKRASILMVDDQPARLLTYEAMLSGLGVECVRALSGAEALEKLLKQEFAVILLDVHMPEMDGFEVARLVREHPRMERMPIIFVTGVHVSEIDQLKGYEVGAIDYIAVPVVPEILRSKVAMLVELHQRRSELKDLNAELQRTRAQIEAEHAAAIAEKDAQLRTAMIGTVQDVTEQRKLQEALQQADRRKNEFLAMLAHELRNPIAPIRNAAEVLARLFAHEAQPSSLIGMIQRQSAHLSRILDDLLDVARITQGRIELRREVLSLATCIDLALETLQPQVAANRHRLVFARTAQPLHVNADKVRLEQCIGNLLSNAVKYTDPDGEIVVRLFTQDDVAVIEVMDTGIGIAAEFLPRVFDVFAQSERALDRSAGGLGIGLSVCKRLIEMHGGSVSAASKGLGQGAIFTLRLPLHVSPLDATTPAAAQTASTHRVLIVDDNRDAADSLAMCLVLEGHEAKAVYSAEAALDQVPTFAPDVVLLDIGLPHMDGYEVARRIKAARPTVRVAALTGYGQEEDKQRTAAAGFEAHLIKPLDMHALKAVLQPR